MANNVDHDQTLRSVPSDLGLHFAQTCLSEYVECVRYFDQIEAHEKSSCILHPSLKAVLPFIMNVHDFVAGLLTP